MDNGKMKMGVGKGKAGKVRATGRGRRGAIVTNLVTRRRRNGTGNNIGNGSFRGGRGNRGRSGGRVKRGGQIGSGFDPAHLESHYFMQDLCTMITGEMHPQWCFILNQIYSKFHKHRSLLEKFLENCWRARGIKLADLTNFLIITGFEGYQNPDVDGDIGQDLRNPITFFVAACKQLGINPRVFLQEHVATAENAPAHDPPSALGQVEAEHTDVSMLQKNVHNALLDGKEEIQLGNDSANSVRGQADGAREDNDGSQAPTHDEPPAQYSTIIPSLSTVGGENQALVGATMEGYGEEDDQPKGEMDEDIQRAPTQNHVPVSSILNIAPRPTTSSAGVSEGTMANYCENDYEGEGDDGEQEEDGHDTDQLIQEIVEMTGVPQIVCGIGKSYGDSHQRVIVEEGKVCDVNASAHEENENGRPNENSSPAQVNPVEEESGGTTDKVAFLSMLNLLPKVQAKALDNIPDNETIGKKAADGCQAGRKNSPENRKTRQSCSSNSTSYSEEEEPIPVWKLSSKGSKETTGPPPKTKALANKKRTLKRRRIISTSSSTSSLSDAKPVPIVKKLSKGKNRSARSANKSARDLKDEVETSKDKRKRLTSSSSDSSLEVRPVKIRKWVKKRKNTAKVVTIKSKCGPTRRSGFKEVHEKFKMNEKSERFVSKKNESVNWPPRPPATSGQLSPRPSSSKKHITSQRQNKGKFMPKPGTSKKGHIICTEDGCHSTFTRQASLKRHLREVHGTATDAEDDLPRFLCPKKGCNTNFKRKSDVTVHIRNVHSRGEVKCQYCGKCFKCQKSVNEHQRRTCKLAKKTKGKTARKQQEEGEESDDEVEVAGGDNQKEKEEGG